MEKFLIAGLKTEYNVRGALLKERSAPYKADFESGETQIRLNIKGDFLEQQRKAMPHLSWEEHEYMWTCEAFYRELLNHGGIMLHSSCVEKDGYAYLFSARSGTGKSTHTHLWLKNLENTRIINDDKPALVREKGVWYACGTPFSGKTDENLNVKVPVRAIVFLHRSEENEVKPLELSRAVGMFLSQTVNPSDRSLSEKMLEILDILLREIPVFSLGCNMNDDAAAASYNGIEGLISK